MTTILINGYTGKIGSKVYNHLKNRYTLIGCNQAHPIEEALKTDKPDLIIDLTSAKIIPQLLKLYQVTRVPTIIGTSGIDPKMAYHLVDHVDFPLMIVPNFCPSFHRFVHHCLELLPHANSVRIIETHHQSKVDSPSGTSLFLAHHLNTSDIQSRRLKRYIAKHEVIFEGDHQSITISHQVRDHEAFLTGVLKAIHLIQSKMTPMVLFSEQ